MRRAVHRQKRFSLVSILVLIALAYSLITISPAKAADAYCQQLISSAPKLQSMADGSFIADPSKAVAALKTVISEVEKLQKLAASSSKKDFGEVSNFLKKVLAEAKKFDPKKPESRGQLAKAFSDKSALNRYTAAGNRIDAMTKKRCGFSFGSGPKPNK
jgi:hypothetical protein